ncbi:MAG: hypothetical protein CVU74_02765 [Deltaproteobacteria bacterium HGW-Deltaproteobacteria-9]|nr:MAG: hypothetical protein CVU74_02765 [Deltaproteobacteria bacterium HGW-Deltaproteobacteria-9]
MKRKTTNPIIMREPPAGYDESAIVIYQSPEGVRVNVKLEKETVWLNLNQMAVLIAESQPREKDILTRVLINLISRRVR